MSGQILYLDPWSGVSGDMMLAALLDADREAGRLEVILRSTVDALGLEGTKIDISRDVERGLDCTRVRVEGESAAPLRRLPEMEQIISGAALPRDVRERSLAAVRRLAETEAAVHGCAVDQIHFHEIGAVDTLVDIVGTFALVDALEIESVYVGTIPVGGGRVEIAHGVMGVPAPATARLLEGFPVVGGPEDGELTTPTGALLVGELGARAGVMPGMRPHRIGYGAGTMKLSHGPNVLRVVVGSAMEPSGAKESVVELETNLDDVSPEVVAHAAEALLSSGALDVWSVPVVMKKGRPGVVLHALVCEEAEPRMVEKIFRETGTLGVRRTTVPRYVAERGTVEVQGGEATVRVKWGKWEGRLVSVAPEYADCRDAAAASDDMTVTEVQRLVTEAAYKTLTGESGA